MRILASIEFLSHVVAYVLGAFTVIGFDLFSPKARKVETAAETAVDKLKKP